MLSSLAWQDMLHVEALGSNTLTLFTITVIFNILLKASLLAYRSTYDSGCSCCAFLAMFTYHLEVHPKIA